MRLAIIVLFSLMAIPVFAQSDSQILPTENGILDVAFSTTPAEIAAGEGAKLNINFINPTTQKTQVHIDYKVEAVIPDGQQIVLTGQCSKSGTCHTSAGSVKLPFAGEADGIYTVTVYVSGILFQPITVEAVSFDVAVGDQGTAPTDEIENIEPEGEASATGMLSDGTAVLVYASAPAEDEMMEIRAEFADSKHVNYDLTITQNGLSVLDDTGVHAHMGVETHRTAPLDSADPVDLTITFRGYGVDEPKTGPIGEAVTFTSIVPEFGTAVMILAVAIISIVLLTSRSAVLKI